MKTARKLMVVFMAVVFVAAANAASIYVDISSSQTFPGNHDSSVDRYWNVLTSLGGSLIDMVDESNSVTTVDLTVADGFDDQGTAGKTGSTLVDWGDEVTDDSYYLYSGAGDGGYAQLRLDGLVANGYYDLTFYGARGLGGSRNLQIDIDAFSGTMNTMDEGELVFTGVAADAGGSITIDLNTLDAYAHLNGMKITPVAPPPEPSDFEAIYVDINGSQAFPGNYDSSQSRYWNVLTSLSGSIADMVDESNSVTTVDLTVADGFDAQGTAGKTGSTLVDWGDPVTDDSYYLYSGAGDGGYAQLRLDGLVANGYYDLTFYGARGLSGSRNMQIDTGAFSGTMNTMSEGKVVFNGVAADAGGSITIDLNTLDAYAHLNGMQVAKGVAPDTILDFSAVPGNMMQAIHNFSYGRGHSYPEATTNLVDGAWIHVAHSHTNDVATLELTNLTYSATDGTNETIYVLADTAEKFFRLAWESPPDRPFPILAWHACYASLLSDGTFDDMAHAGFNLGLTRFSDTASNQKALALGEKYGIGIVLRDPRIDYQLAGAPQSQAVIEAAVNQWKDYPALAKYSVMDEPHTNYFAELARIKGIIAGVDTNHPAYVNLFPNYATSGDLGTWPYSDYVDSFMATFAPEMLSYDHYPITTSGVRPEFYENLEIIRAAATNAAVPFSAFTQSTPHLVYPPPTEGRLRFQLYSALAYGAKELQYFTYAKVDDSSYGDGLIDAAGNTTDTYDMASEINWEIQHMGPVLLDLESAAVFHTAPIPSGTTLFTGHAGLASCSGEALLGFFEDSASQTWLMVVNRDPYLSEPLTLTFDGSVASVWELDRTVPGGVVNEVTLTSQQATISLAAGDGRLFRIDTM